VNLAWKKPSRFWLLLILVGMILVGASLTALWFCVRLPPCSSPIEVGASDLFTFDNLRDHYEPYGYVAHAFGNIDEHKYTNSREAFELNYEKGFRVFEVDLVLLKDGSAFCAHDGAEPRYGLDKPFLETTAEELSGALFDGKYTPLTGSALLDLVYEYSDAYFILDTKLTTSGSSQNIFEALVSEARKRCPSVLDRMIPHIFGPEDLTDTAEVYPFKDYMLALYQCKCSKTSKYGMTNGEVVQFVKDNHIKAVMMWWDDRYTPKFKRQLNDAGAVVYVHDLDDPTIISDFRAQGVGVYSNGYFPPMSE
jgi:glycerophosphoryl diester phosphodiesterase